MIRRAALSIMLVIGGVIGLIQGHGWLGLFILVCGIATAFTCWVLRG